MNRDEAKQLVRETFQNPFDKDRFYRFTKELLNHFEDAPFIYRGNYIPDAYDPYIQTLERIGKYQDPEGKKIDILVARLKKETSLERARTTQRNFIAWYLNGSRGGELKDAALVAFVPPNPDEWRFSLVKMEYKIDPEKGKAREEFTPARRYSFIVGKNESSHTAQSRLVPILEREDEIFLKDIEEAFSVEKVTKEFFEKYRELFIRIVDELDKVIRKNEDLKKEFESKNINTVDFSKKLLGQILFLYFLQKKGWFGVKRGEDWGGGSRHFLRELFNKKHGNYDNFFNDILEPLFYEALRIERPGDYYSRFDCRIPFLNGGLFDPINNYDWWNIDILLPNELFSNNLKTKEGDVGTGILDVFDRYNFTVKEDEPLEKEVAIDPELLGKAYEKFNAIRPDNYGEYKKALKSGQKGAENKFNKQYGVYYTPREIVHYMCQESLINYLATELEGKINKEDIDILIRYGESVVEHDSRVIITGRETERYSFKLPESIRKNAKLIDEKLSCVRVCDPAVGSGAFPVGMMTLIIRTRNALTPYISNGNNRTLYNFKRQAIQNCLYGVDIDPGAIEIAKLRLWLSLIVDEEDIKQIKPLPNLDYKIMQGDSLISEFMGINLDKEDESQDGQLNLQKSETDVLIQELKKKKDEYLNKANAREKEELKQEIEDLVIRIFETKLQKQKSDYFKQLKSIEEKYKVIPNAREREEIIKKEKDRLYQTTGLDLEKFEQQLREFTTGNKIRPFFPWHLYFAEVFQEKGGFDIVIANPPYVRQERIKDYKPSLQKAGYHVFNSTSDLYTYFYEKSFNILAPNRYLCFISSNKWMRAKYGENLRKFLKEKTRVLNLIDFGGYPVFEATVDTNIILFKKETPDREHLLRFVNVQSQIDGDLITHVTKHQNLMLQEKLSNNAWTLADESVLSLKEKIEKIGKPLKDWDVRIYRGILTGFNEAFIIDTETRNRILANCETEEERERTEEIIKPVLRGRDIGRYYYRWEGMWLIKIESGWTNKNRGKKKPDEFFKETYPALYQYLISFADKEVQGRRKGLLNRDDQGDYWWELRDCDYYPEFQKEKIVWQRVTKQFSFCLVPKSLYILDSMAFMIGENLHYLLGILNSKLIDFYVESYVHLYGDTGFLLSNQYVERISILPIIPGNEPLVRQIETSVDKILSAKKQNPQADTTEYQKHIDGLVYKLYGLTPEEIEIVERTL